MHNHTVWKNGFWGKTIRTRTRKKKIMDAKEKAKELLDKFWNCGMMPYEAKKCAIILCDETIEALSSIQDINVSGNILLDAIEYWQSVKIEIEKL